MKKILIFVIVFMGFSLSSYAENINECKTDIYYGNGVWNSSEDAKKSRRALEKRIINKEIIKGDPLLKAKYGKTKLAYNWGQGTLFDVLETYYQLREEGQLDGVGFYTAIAALTIKLPHITLGAIATQKLWEPFTKDWEQGNVDEMWQKYYHESFKLGHRVLLVSHSQGNLFANRIYDTINPPEYRKYFANVQVASPASEVKANEVGKGAYVTLFGDPIINPIPGSMSGNANGSPGHAFVAAYLDQQDPYNKIVSRIKAVLPTLDVELTQWDVEGEPSNKGTCEEKVKVKHRFDLAVDMPFDVYPFNLSKKLYQVNGEWVKASCGGKNILDQWEGKKDNECWMIDNPEKEKIIRKRRIVQKYSTIAARLVVQADYRGGKYIGWGRIEDFGRQTCPEKIGGSVSTSGTSIGAILNELYSTAHSQAMSQLSSTNVACYNENWEINYRHEQVRNGCYANGCYAIGYIYQDAILYK